ncbi:hypothetical protein XBP1_990023 [Xenorhabdus bovienii str. puntauvense]|uniref:Uncharacterized protein n=1 Tax=Xenorhabdus bovienii str. puntauvense TaxID=1398201 RepID=A0A077NLP0_XENBV|nr:hypothetical protein XBP1_990023 [Xenorhabdus bovienii str. puntauvense]
MICMYYPPNMAYLVFQQLSLFYILQLKGIYMNSLLIIYGAHYQNSIQNSSLCKFEKEFSFLW